GRGGTGWRGAAHGGPGSQRMLPWWPRLYRPGWGQYMSPWGLAPVAMVLMILPVSGSMTSTVPLYRFETHICEPSGEKEIMSGEAPTFQLAVTFCVARSMTEMVPAIRLVT